MTDETQYATPELLKMAATCFRILQRASVRQSSVNSSPLWPHPVLLPRCPAPLMHLPSPNSSHRYRGKCRRCRCLLPRIRRGHRFHRGSATAVVAATVVRLVIVCCEEKRMWHSYTCTEDRFQLFGLGTSYQKVITELKKLTCCKAAQMQICR